jgi:hypothetical protein
MKKSYEQSGIIFRHFRSYLKKQTREMNQAYPASLRFPAVFYGPCPDLCTGKVNIYE